MNYPEKESSVLEFKQTLPNKPITIIKTVIGFANMHGGQIIIGVEDDGKISGINEAQTDQWHDNLTRSIYDSITPTLFPSIYTKRLSDKLVMIIDIAEGATKPYHLNAKQISNSTYVRLGAHTMLATADIIHQLQWQGRRKFLDEMPVHTANKNEIDMGEFEKFLSDRKQKTNDINRADMLKHYEILVKDRTKTHPSVGGLLLFGKNPQQYFSEAFIICTHFSGTSGRDVIATRDITGHLIQQYKDALAFIISRLNTSFKITETTIQREDQLEIPIDAIREIVINAIVHRNYQITGPTKIAIYDDRLEIFSPGNFPGPILVDKTDIGVTYIRNTIITKVFRDLGIIEKLGSGFITLFESYLKRGLPKPIVTEGVGFVKCILPRPLPKDQKVLTDETDLILQLLLTKQSIKSSDLITHLGVSRATATRLLSKLSTEGILEKIGKGSATRYIKSNSL